MSGHLLLRGMLAGLIAGLVAFGFARVYGEPQVERAIAFEELMAAAEAPAAGAIEEPEAVSRETQAGIGLLTGVLAYGVAMGGIFSLVFAGLYGRVGSLSPRALEDEASPFNECSHAYLSAARMLLLHMRDMPSISAEANDMVSVIDAEMVRRGSALIQCEYSADPFYTGDFLTPHWEKLVEHRPSLIAALSPLVLVLGFAFLRRRLPLRQDV